ncbi:hypothetical protein F5Y18DRAFT_221956 [Xylariaceae sp. FL1019]|nr:hypothetical protein F5Y18DRAFT_221956 [Xylariaceae sp. FL1019]
MWIMSATGDGSYAPKSPDLSSFYGPDEVDLSSAITGDPANTYRPLQSVSPYSYTYQGHSSQAQAQTQVPQTHLQVGAHNFSQAQPHHQHPHPYYPAAQAPYSSYSNNNRDSTTSSATTGIANHRPEHRPYQPSAPSAGAAAAVPLSYSHLGSNPHYYPPQLQHQPPQQPQYPPLQHGQPVFQLNTNAPAAPHQYYSHSQYAEPNPGPRPTTYLQTAETSQQPPLPPQVAQTLPRTQSISFDQPIDFSSHTSQPTMPPRKAAAPVAKEPEIMASPVRTKFPTARIKRIMQADDEVGKVAQQTPIAVGKALELFMVQLVEKSAEVARDKHSKRITAPMLKQAIDSTNEWDFLRDIVAKVSEEKEGAKGGRAKAESESDEDVDMGEVKKKGRGGRKKKATA